MWTHHQTQIQQNTQLPNPSKAQRLASNQSNIQSKQRPKATNTPSHPMLQSKQCPKPTNTPSQPMLQSKQCPKPTNTPSQPMLQSKQYPKPTNVPIQPMFFNLSSHSLSNLYVHSLSNLYVRAFHPIHVFMCPCVQPRSMRSIHSKSPCVPPNPRLYVPNIRA